MHKPLTSPVSRRRVLVAGAGTAGALAAAASVLPLQPTPSDTAADEAERARDDARGYRLTQHVLRYYQTAKV